MSTILSKRVGLDNSLSKRRVKVYDVEKKELIAEFESVTEAAEFTGVHTGSIARYIKRKYRCYTNKLNRTICFR